ncbi:hypothetical protein CI610_03359 [invertebrate metagenome]|uniref:Uncharacterized protein n=1 Tax=invertebrate metagenome TaxID=1711999 RepID=A0A2H9T3A6_9ZZZZ
MLRERDRWLSGFAGPPERDRWLSGFAGPPERDRC